MTEFEFHEMSVRDNRTVTLQDVLLGEEYEVRVSSVEVSTGKMSPLSSGLAIGEKDVMAILNVLINIRLIASVLCVYVCVRESTVCVYACVFICVCVCVCVGVNHAQLPFSFICESDL